MKEKSHGWALCHILLLEENCFTIILFFSANNELEKVAGWHKPILTIYILFYFILKFSLPTSEKKITKFYTVSTKQIIKSSKFSVFLFKFDIKQAKSFETMKLKKKKNRKKHDYLVVCNVFKSQCFPKIWSLPPAPLFPNPSFFLILFLYVM
jgi:hypothetical protein